MKVGMISRTIPPFDRGGIQRHVRDLSTALGQRGMDVHLFIKGKDINVGPGVHVHPVSSFPIPRLTAGEYVSLSLNAGRKARKIDLDLVHVHSMYGFGQALVGKTPMVATLHGTQVNELRAVASSDKVNLNHLATDSVSVVMEGYVARKAGIIITVSDQNKLDVIDHYDIPPDRIRVIPNGIWPDRYRPSDMSTKDIVFLGRLHERKGVPDLISAMPALLEEHPESRLIVIGSGELEADMKSLTKELGLVARIEFTGHVPDERVAEIMSHASLFVMPSLYEGFGMVMIEAMASGLPVVATPSGGAPQVIRNGENGWLLDIDLDSADSDLRRNSLADAMIDALSDEARLARMGRSAREHAVSDYSWNQIAEQTQKVYEDALEISQ